MDRLRYAHRGPKGMTNIEKIPKTDHLVCQHVITASLVMRMSTVS